MDDEYLKSVAEGVGKVLIFREVDGKWEWGAIGFTHLEIAGAGDLIAAKARLDILNSLGTKKDGA